MIAVFSIAACLVSMAVFMWLWKVLSGGGDMTPQGVDDDKVSVQVTNETSHPNRLEVFKDSKGPYDKKAIRTWFSFDGFGCLAILVGVGFLFWLYAQYTVGDSRPPDQFDVMPSQPR